jgi:nucleotide-binding universal stress UspA family protein
MYDRIVVPLDGSDFANVSLMHAKDLAKRLAVPVHVVRAIDPTVINRVGAAGIGFDYTAVDELIIEDEQAATTFIDEQVNALIADGFNATGIVLRGYAAAAVNSATQEGDLIVMASHGRTGVRRWFLGSVAEEVVRHASVPVLLIRMPDPDGE